MLNCDLETESFADSTGQLDLRVRTEPQRQFAAAWHSHGTLINPPELFLRQRWLSKLRMVEQLKDSARKVSLTRSIELEIRDERQVEVDAPRPNKSIPAKTCRKC